MTENGMEVHARFYVDVVIPQPLYKDDKLKNLQYRALNAGQYMLSHLRDKLENYYRIFCREESLVDTGCENVTAFIYDDAGSVTELTFTSEEVEGW